MGLWKMQIIYNAEPTPDLFHQSNAFVRGLRGPRRGGKTVSCGAEMFRRGHEQIHGPDGIRHTRFAIIRNTYRELLDTTLKTWLQWFPEDIYGKFNYGNMIHHIKRGDVDMELLFRSLDKPGDISKLLSLELTGAWINEAKEIHIFSLIEGLIDTLGQYPMKNDGGCTWHGLIMDTNSCDTEHWWYKMAEEKRPDNWEFFNQPGAVIEVDGKFVINPKAENLENLNEGADYYLSRIQSHSRDYVKVYYCNEYGFVKDGIPVHSDYADATHFVDEDLDPVPGIPIIVGLDFGLTPAAAFLQKQASGQWVWFDEIVTDVLTEKAGMVKFIEEEFKPKINSFYKDFEIEIWGDPSGGREAETDQETCFQILYAKGFCAKPTLSNDSTLRREAMATPLRRMVNGRPGIVLGRKVKEGRKGMAGGYCYKRKQVSSEQYKTTPDKDSKYSHIVEAAEYALLGAGEGKALIRKPYKPKPINHQPGQPGGWMG